MRRRIKSTHNDYGRCDFAQPDQRARCRSRSSGRPGPRHATGLTRPGAGLPAAPAVSAGEGFAAREAGHPQKGWNSTVHVSRCSDRVLDHGSEQRPNVTPFGLARPGPACHLAGRRTLTANHHKGRWRGLSLFFGGLTVAGRGCRLRRGWTPPVGRYWAGLWLAYVGPSASTTAGLRRESGVTRSSIEPTQ